MPAWISWRDSSVFAALIANGILGSSAIGCDTVWSTTIASPESKALVHVAFSESHVQPHTPANSPPSAAKRTSAMPL
jgi:hypothetical protein